MTRNGYTLIEMVVALGLFLLILLGGTTLFSQNLRSGGLTEVELNLNGSLRSVLDEFERVLRFGKVTAVDNVDRDQCLDLASVGYTGTTLSVEDLNGSSSIYSLVANKIASTSAVTNAAVYLNNTDIKVNSFSVSWYCQSGISDKIKIDINAETTALGSGITISRTVSRDLVLLNGSTN